MSPKEREDRRWRVFHRKIFCSALAGAAAGFYDMNAGLVDGSVRTAMKIADAAVKLMRPSTKGRP